MAQAGPPPLVLAKVYRGDEPLGDYLVSEKFDGVRAYWDGERLLSRQGYPITAPAWFVADFPSQPLDGELWMGRGAFEAVSAAVRRQVPDEDEWRRIRFMAFDAPAAGETFTQRWERLQALWLTARSPYLGLVVQFEAEGRILLAQLLDEVVSSGGEGLMLRRAESLATAGRSEDLLKLKPYDDAEAVVIGYTPGRGKYVGLTGALVVETPDGLRFRIGSGLTDADRQSPPPIGSTVTFRYRGHTSQGIPRFATYLRVREMVAP